MNSCHTYIYLHTKGLFQSMYSFLNLFTVNQSVKQMQNPLDGCLRKWNHAKESVEFLHTASTKFIRNTTPDGFMGTSVVYEKSKIEIPPDLAKTSLNIQ